MIYLHSNHGHDVRGVRGRAQDEQVRRDGGCAVRSKRDHGHAHIELRRRQPRRRGTNSGIDQ